MKLYVVDDDYIEYLKKFDNHVLNYSGKDYKNKRKYLGILLNINECKYIAPLSSPNKKTDYLESGEIRKSIVPIIRIVSNENLLGTIKLSSMIPVYDETVISYYNIKDEKDIKYKNLVSKEYKFININKEYIIKNALKLYTQKINNMSMKYVQETVNFKLLEEKAKLYMNKKIFEV
ncbi:MAG: type III toxin-antitoxin system ToxN/AbiQ family toxin [Pseudoleptotrichia goodfellowii]|nr:type III toxin-antitoxin system ToxN/AbiQ family toxin [Pseudoleptotrichia goodfellowii]